VRAGADYLVVGRAILDHADPAQAIAEINRELQEASRPMTQTAITGDAL
jgi:orotidine-5'-phosphate decarboxylase